MEASGTRKRKRLDFSLKTNTQKGGRGYEMLDKFITGRFLKRAVFEVIDIVCEYALGSMPDDRQEKIDFLSAVKELREFECPLYWEGRYRDEYIKKGAISWDLISSELSDIICLQEQNTK